MVFTKLGFSQQCDWASAGLLGFGTFVHVTPLFPTMPWTQGCRHSKSVPCRTLVGGQFHTVCRFQQSVVSFRPAFRVQRFDVHQCSSPDLEQVFLRVLRSFSLLPTIVSTTEATSFFMAIIIPQDVWFPFPSSVHLQDDSVTVLVPENSNTFFPLPFPRESTCIRSSSSASCS